MKYSNSPPRRNVGEGFSLLEVLVALMILVFGLATIFGLYGTATYSHRRGVNDALITRMSAAILSELQSGQHLASLDLQNRSAQQYSGFPSIYTYDLAFETISGMSLSTSRIVTLTIKWPKGGKTSGSEIFKTLLIFPNQP
ncbi:MAG: prepilin-type N-terminal cleavage/methylation domain-containing protein [Planctomycetota bacterium]